MWFSEVPRHDRGSAQEIEGVTTDAPARPTATLRALLEGIVDYAGLYPPAQLDMRSAVRCYAEYRASGEAWMLGRFVLPIARLEEFAAERRVVEDGSVWRLSGIAGGDTVADIARAVEFNHARGSLGAVIDSLEAKLASVDDIRRAASRLSGDMELYVEIPVKDDPQPLVRAIADVGAKAKIRTGGTTAEAFPSSAEVVRFLRRCVERGASFKATAGLHHPIRARYRLTYDPGAPEGTMFGFLNLFLAAAALRHGANDEDAAEILESTSASSFTFGEDNVAWRDRRLTTEQIRVARRTVARSFGSCSFREPVDDLRSLHLL